MAKLMFNPQEHEPAGTFEPIPPDVYTLVCKASDMKETQDKRGAYLELEHEVVDGPFKGRKIYDRLNLKNESDKTVKIAQSQLSALCRAVGKLNPIKDSSELHGIPFQAKVGVEEGGKAPNGKEYGPKNVIKRYVFEDEKAKPKQAQSASPSANAGSDEDMPAWMK